MLFAVVGLFLLCLGPQVPARVLFEIHGPHSPLVLAYMSVRTAFPLPLPPEPGGLWL